VDDGTLPPQLTDKAGAPPPPATSSGDKSTANVSGGTFGSAGVEAKAAADSDVLAHIGDIDVKVGDVKIALQQLFLRSRRMRSNQNPVAFPASCGICGAAPALAERSHCQALGSTT